jgi:hypothetical protein
MQGSLILILLLVEVVVLSRLDNRRFGTWVTPFNTLAFPYTAVVLLAYFIAPALDFVPLYMPSVLIWIVGLFLVWAAGALLGWGMLDLRGKTESRKPISSTALYEPETIRLATILAWIAIPVMVYGFITCARGAGGWAQIGTQDFKDAYSHGIASHAQVLGALLAILLIGLYRRGGALQIATIAILIVLITLSQIKGHTIIVMCGGLLFRLVRGVTRLSVKKVTLVILLTYIVFNIPYLISIGLATPDEAFTGHTCVMLARHYFYYVCAGPLAFGEAVRSRLTDIGEPWPVIFAPFINFYRFILHTGSLLSPVSSRAKGTNTDLLGGMDVTTNVYTFCGTLYLYLGGLGAALYVIGVGLLCYGFLIVSKRANAWVLASYCYVAGNLSLGFFEFYFWQLMSYEVIVMAVTVAYCGKIFIRGPDPLPKTKLFVPHAKT